MDVSLEAGLPTPGSWFEREPVVQFLGGIRRTSHGQVEVDRIVDGFGGWAYFGIGFDAARLGWLQLVMVNEPSPTAEAAEPPRPGA